MPPRNLKRAVFLDIASVNRNDLDLSALEAVIPEWTWMDNTSESDLPGIMADVDVVVCNKVALGAELLQQSPRLKLICVAATGTNNIHIEAAASHRISVCNVRAYATASVVQHVFALILALTTRLREHLGAVENGDWCLSQHFCFLDYPLHELHGQTIGIVGYGELGKAVAEIAKAFGMSVCLAKRDAQDAREGRLDLHDLLAQVDILSLHCPLTESTRLLIGEKELKAMKNTAFLINTARGEIVDSRALVDALRNKTIMGAGIDVLDSEPPSADHPLLVNRMPNLIVTPHVAWASVESRQRLINELAVNIQSFIDGKPRNVVA